MGSISSDPNKFYNTILGPRGGLQDFYVSTPDWSPKNEYSKEYLLEYTFVNIFKNQIILGQMSINCSLSDFSNYDNSFIRCQVFEPFVVLESGR